jgi:hypothetical protein
LYNKRIKIKPYPNFQITNDCFENDVKSKSFNDPLENISDQLVMIAEFKDGNRRVLRSNVVENNNGDKFISVSPNPILLYIDSSLENFYKSEELKNKSFLTCGKKSNKKINDIYLLDIDVDETHHCYNEYIKSKINSILLITTSIEGFCNSLLPNDIFYIKGKEIKNKIKYQKETYFKDKLDEMIPEFTKEDYWLNNNDSREKISKIYQIRNGIIHLKTDNDSFKNYSKVIKDVVDINLYEYIESIINTLNDISKKVKNENFIEFTNEEYISSIDNNKIDYDFINIYLKSKNIQIHNYFKKSKTKIRSWENNKIPTEDIEYFIKTEGDNIKYFLNILSERYYKK